MMVVVTVIVISRFPVRSARWEMIVFALWEIVWERFQSVVVVFTAFDALIRRDVTFFGNIYFARHYVNVHKRSFGTKIADFPVLFSGEIVRFGALLRRFVENFANYVLSKYRDALGHVKSCFDSCKNTKSVFSSFRTTNRRWPQIGKQFVEKNQILWKFCSCCGKSQFDSHKLSTSASNNLLNISQ